MIGLLALAAAGCGGSASRPTELPRLHIEGRSFKDPTGKTVVLRGVALADLKDVDDRGGAMNVARLIDLVSDASQGWYARVVRLTVFPPIWQPDPDDYLANHLTPAVEHATRRGLYVIIDWHEISDAAAADQRTRDFWARAAPMFARYPNVLFELFNEAEDVADPSWTRWKTLAQPWIDQIRRDAPDTIVLIGAPLWTQAVGDAASDPFVGTNLAYVGHIYPAIDASLWGPGGAFTQVAATRPMMITEWGYRAGASVAVTVGDQGGFGNPLKAFVESMGVGWTAWCADNTWEPIMFDTSWNLRAGPDEMGGFVKDWLAEKKDADRPAGVISPPP